MVVTTHLRIVSEPIVRNPEVIPADWPKDVAR
jgi:hypothetical protein